MDETERLTLKLHRLIGVLQGKGIIDDETGRWIINGGIPKNRGD